MKLAVTKRTEEKKSELGRLRREGGIPAILYSKGEEGRKLVVSGNAFKKMLAKFPKGTLSSKVFILVLDGQEIKALVKDIQYRVTTYDIIHLDFEQLHDDCEVTLNIPITCTGVVDCVGVKLGGVLRQVIRQVRVRTLPKNLPDEFTLDVRDLGLGQSRRLRDLAIPSGVRPISDLKEVAVVVSRR